jgi:hypothetical protein
VNINSRIGIQVFGVGLNWMSLEEYNQAESPLELKFIQRK